MAEPINPEVLTKLTSILGEQPTEEVTEDVSEDVIEDEVAEEDTPETDDQETDDADDSDDGEEESSEDDDVIGEEYFDDTFVIIDGQKVKLGELKNGYTRHSDYTRKTQELSEQRKQVEAYAKEAEAKANDLVRQRFELVALDVEKKLKDYNQVDWKTLARTNPNDYTALKAEYDSLIQDAHTLEREYKEIQRQQMETYEKQLEEQAKQSYQILKEKIPSWSKETYSNMMEYAVKAGLRQDVAANIVDAPSLELIYKAYMYDKVNGELKTKVEKKDKPSVQTKLKPKAKVDVSKDEIVRDKSQKIKEKLSKVTSKHDRSKLEADLVFNTLFGNKK